MADTSSVALERAAVSTRERVNKRTAALLATTALFIASSVSAHAQSDWTGLFSSNWFLSGNWIGGVPRQTTRRNH